MLIANETFSSCLLKLEEKFMHKIKLFLTVRNKFYRNTLRKIKNLPILKTHTRTKKNPRKLKFTISNERNN